MALPAFVAPGPLAHGNTALPMLTPRRARCKPSPSHPSMHFLEAAHSAPEFVGHVVASCSAALVGVLGARATRGPRALFTSRFAARRRVAAEARHMRRLRRAELAEGAQLGYSRDWDELDVDASENRVVPLFDESANFVTGAQLEQFKSFDQMLEKIEGEKTPRHQVPRKVQGLKTRPAGDEFLDADALWE